MAQDIVQYEIHEFANYIPRMGSVEFDGLVTNIRNVGKIRNKLVILDDKILDGRHRYDAYVQLKTDEENPMLDLELPTVQFEEVADGMTPVEYVFSENLHRRQLSKSQIAMLAARSVEIGYVVPLKGRGQVDPASTRSRAELFGVSNRYVNTADRVLREATPAQIQMVESGLMALSAVEKELDEQKQAEKPEPEQPIVEEDNEPEEPQVDEELEKLAKKAESLSRQIREMEKDPDIDEDEIDEIREAFQATRTEIMSHVESGSSDDDEDDDEDETPEVEVPEKQESEYERVPVPEFSDEEVEEMDGLLEADKPITTDRYDVIVIKPSAYRVKEERDWAYYYELDSLAADDVYIAVWSTPDILDKVVRFGEGWALDYVVTFHMTVNPDKDEVGRDKRVNEMSNMPMSNSVSLVLFKSGEPATDPKELSMYVSFDGRTLTYEDGLPLQVYTRLMKLGEKRLSIGWEYEHSGFTNIGD